MTPMPTTTEKGSVIDTAPIVVLHNFPADAVAVLVHFRVSRRLPVSGRSSGLLSLRDSRRQFVRDYRRPDIPRDILTKQDPLQCSPNQNALAIRNIPPESRISAW